MRLWERTEEDPSGCWLWTGATSAKGYGVLWHEGHCWYAHRLAFREVKGGLRKGLVLDHLCRTRHCVRPEHLEQVTNRENLRRGNRPIRHDYLRRRAGRSSMTNNLKQYRTAQRLTQAEVAEIAGVATETVNRIECCERAPHFTTQRALANALGVPVDDVFTYNNEVSS